MLWKVLAGKTNSAKKVKTPHGFPSFYSVSFRCRLLEGFCFAGRFWVFRLFIVSHSGVGFWKVLALLEGSGWENQFTKKR